MVVIGVDSLEDAVAKAEGAGAVVLLAKQTIPSVDYSAYLRDCEGNVVGLFESDGDAG